ncbi:MAG TPA: hypothetical protein VNI84_13590 [Pyrinomonadaceae bacterium]|nr:hypothetical protein [Pyrinomonadaceae bacterium]
MERQSEDESKPDANEKGGADSKQAANNQVSGKKFDSVPFWEWFVAGVGSVLVLGTIGFMLYQATNGKTSPPDVTVQSYSVVNVRNGYLVKFRAVNHGDLAAAAVSVEGELKDQSGKSVETSSASVRYCLPVL